MRFPKEAKQIVDVTKAPYNCDPTGKQDCTAALVRAMDDALAPARDAYRETVEYFTRHPYTNEGKQVVRAGGRVGSQYIHPLNIPPVKTLYFPSGTYLVSDTVRYSFRDLQSTLGSELNRLMIFRGESQTDTVIKLRDDCEGFEEGTQRPVVDFMGGISTNNAMHNYFENMTIDVGAGNPGAVGIVFFSNNAGAVRNVTIRSSDDHLAGAIGLHVRNRNVSGALFQHLEIEGFDIGVRVLHNRLNTVMEHVHLAKQRRFGVHVDRHNISMRRIVSQNSVPALKIAGREAVVAVVDCEFQGGDPDTPAIQHREGYLYARDISTSGYACALSQQGEMEIAGEQIGEYGSDDPIVLFAEEDRRGLNLPVEETPHISWENDMEKWACVNDYGAVPDGKTDASDAVQQAVDSGKPVVWFQPGEYLIDQPVELPATLRRLNFMNCNLAAGENLWKMHGEGAFRIVGESDEPLIIEDLYTHEAWRGGHYLVDHACRRTLVLSDICCLLGAVYTNSVEGGKVFIENVFSQNKSLRENGCFHFKGQSVYARQINPEKANPQITNDGGLLWILGFKTEHPGDLFGTAFLTRNGGKTEVLGGTINQYTGTEERPPMIVNEHSDVSIVCSTTDWRGLHRPVRQQVVEEHRGDMRRSMKWGDFPLRGDGELIYIPLYVGRASNRKD